MTETGKIMQKRFFGKASGIDKINKVIESFTNITKDLEDGIHLSKEAIKENEDKMVELKKEIDNHGDAIERATSLKDKLNNFLNS